MIVFEGSLRGGRALDRIKISDPLIADPIKISDPLIADPLIAQTP